MDSSVALSLETLKQRVAALESQLQSQQRRWQALEEANGDVLGLLKWRLDSAGELVLLACNTAGSGLMQRDLGGAVGQTFAQVFPGLQLRPIHRQLCRLAQDGGALPPTPFSGEGLLSGRSYLMMAYQCAQGEVVVKFWDRSESSDGSALRMHVQQQMSAIFGHSPTAISLSRLSDGAFVDVNACWTEVTGYSLQDVLGRTEADIGFWRDSQERIQWLESQGDAGSSLPVMEKPFVRPDRRRVVLQHSANRVEIGDGQYLLSYVRDVTQERANAANLLASEQLLKATNARLQERLQFIQKVTSRAPGVIFQMLRSPEGAYRFLYLAEPLRDMYRGLTAEQVLEDPRCALALHHPDDLPEFRRSIDLSARMLTPWQHEYRLCLAGGEVRWILGHAIPELAPDGSTLWSGFLTDVTDRRHAQERLAASESRFRALTDLSSDWYWEQDAEYRFVRIDGSPTGAMSLEADSLIGKTRWESGVEGVSASEWAKHRADLFAHRTFHDFQVARRLSDGSVMWASISGAPIFDKQGKFIGYRGIGRDITERKRDEDRIERLAFYDALTGLPNRRLLMDRLHSALALRERDGSTGAILFIDLDNFKDLNDTRGHDVGDELLKQVAIRLGECVRDADTVARLGGDEFVVMLQKLSPIADEAAADVETVGRKILQTLNEPYRLSGAEHHSTPSIGVAMFQGEGLTLDELLKRADLAMYQAKAAGRNTLRFFDPTMQAAATARATVEAELRQAMQRDQLVLYYQPVVDAQERTTGVEALVRWVHPTRGMVSPGDFIPVAEQTGLILDLGLWVLRAACQQLVLWRGNALTRDLSISVNVSARQFRHPGFTTQVLDVLRQTGANPYRLKLELTESLLLTDFADVTLKMTELRSIGVSFSLDDFGTGYSSLSYLKQLPLDHLKIDQSFVRGVLHDPNDAAIARTILTLAASLDLGVVAEGVEIAGQRDFLKENGCRSFQGYLFGRPVPVQMLDLRDTASSRFVGL
ncbi:EAL domain-containing protein [Curvibacter sp. APW13]|uniref:EAL domain-containing protein n=1 Tax=Curvibacter sp. APW13 TaxID=3077236 RepID=UPI0028DF5767|nr:EAL domain-containing protein [Curvibacter sp. APW13]MDT8991143.1 EAL domain-containing protein [Curvibacter sp. APW13]